MADKPLEPIHVVSTRQHQSEAGYILSLRLPDCRRTRSLWSTECRRPIRSGRSLTFAIAHHHEARWSSKRGVRIGYFTPQRCSTRIDDRVSSGPRWTSRWPGRSPPARVRAPSEPGAGGKRRSSTGSSEVGPSAAGTQRLHPVLIRVRLGGRPSLSPDRPIAIEVSPYDRIWRRRIYGKDGRKRNDLDLWATG